MERYTGIYDVEEERRKAEARAEVADVPPEDSPQADSPPDVGADSDAGGVAVADEGGESDA